MFNLDGNTYCDRSEVFEVEAIPEKHEQEPARARHSADAQRATAVPALEKDIITSSDETVFVDEDADAEMPFCDDVLVDENVDSQMPNYMRSTRSKDDKRVAKTSAKGKKDS